VTTSTHPDFDPAWSPDGSRIAFASERTGDWDIYVINKDGTGLTRLTTSSRRDSAPAWSPDGTRIAFQRGTNSLFKIYVMKAARESQTNIPKRLTTSGSGVREWNPAWSPNGSRIAFASDQIDQSGNLSGNAQQLYSIRADGSGQNQLTFTKFTAVEMAWSPDGTKIAFERKRGSDSTFGVFVMKAAPESATNRPKRLTGNQFETNSPDWQPLR
jgi:Tol biopolymer transport system component